MRITSENSFRRNKRFIAASILRAASMHLGNFVMISTLMRLQRAGHRIIAVVGGGTGMIGDPSGKSKERNLQNEDTLRANTASIKAQLERFLGSFGSRKKA
jgi:tyrosyl-tRNA synthetase